MLPKWATSSIQKPGPGKYTNTPKCHSNPQWNGLLYRNMDYKQKNNKLFLKMSESNEKYWLLRGNRYMYTFTWDHGYIFIYYVFLQTYSTGEIMIYSNKTIYKFIQHILDSSIKRFSLLFFLQSVMLIQVDHYSNDIFSNEKRTRKILSRCNFSSYT